MLQLGLNEKASLDRPAWTSENKTRLFEAYKHKHTIYRGKFQLLENYYTK